MKNNNLEFRYITTEIRLLESDSRKVGGLAIPVEARSELLSGMLPNSKILGRFHETIKREAISDDMINSMDIKLYMNHDSSQGTYARSKFGVGSLHLFVTDRGLEFETELPNTVFGDQLLEGIRRGDYDAISFAFISSHDDWEKNSDGTWERYITAFDLVDEISILSQLPAYSQTDVNIRSLEAYIEQEKCDEEERKMTILNKLEQKLQEIEEVTKNIKI